MSLIVQCEKKTQKSVGEVNGISVNLKPII